MRAHVGSAGIARGDPRGGAFGCGDAALPDLDLGQEDEDPCLSRLDRVEGAQVPGRLVQTSAPRRELRETECRLSIAGVGTENASIDGVRSGEVALEGERSRASVPIAKVRRMGCGGDQ